MKDTSDIVIKCLIDSDLSNYRIAQDTGISDAAIGYYRKRKTKPSIGNIKVLANYFGIRFDENGEAIVTKSPSSDNNMSGNRGGINNNVVGNNNKNHVNANSGDLEKLISVMERQADQLTKSQEHLTKSQEQIDKLIELLSKK